MHGHSFVVDPSVCDGGGTLRKGEQSGHVSSPNGDARNNWSLQLGSHGNSAVCLGFVDKFDVLGLALEDLRAGRVLVVRVGFGWTVVHQRVEILEIARSRAGSRRLEREDDSSDLETFVRSCIPPAAIDVVKVVSGVGPYSRD